LSLRTIGGERAAHPPIEPTGIGLLGDIERDQHLHDDFFLELAGILNYAFDSRDLLTVWLVGLPLSTVSVAMIDFAMRSAGASTKLLSDCGHTLAAEAARPPRAESRDQPSRSQRATSAQPRGCAHAHLGQGRSSHHPM
jgi:hypothetical protein